MKDDESTRRRLEQMRRDWDRRALENARHYVASGCDYWNTDEYYRSGETNLERDVLTDLGNICQGKQPNCMKVLEIGCGNGRITRALARFFGEVYAVDISGEMVRQARLALREFPNAHIFQNNGCDLTAIPNNQCFDFAFSYIVFQHIPSHEVIESYVREVYRVLLPGALFKFQVAGWAVSAAPRDTWSGVSFTEQQARQMAGRCGFEMRYHHGEGGQYYWLWFFKKPVR